MRIKRRNSKPPSPNQLQPINNVSEKWWALGSLGLSVIAALPGESGLAQPPTWKFWVSLSPLQDPLDHSSPSRWHACSKTSSFVEANSTGTKGY